MGKLETRSLAVAALASLLLVSSAVAAPLADVKVEAAALQLSPIVSVNALQLTVSGPDGFYFRETYDSSNAIFLPFKVDMADGIYDYSLISLAPAQVRGDKAVRVVETFAQSGAFTIKNGVAVDNSLVERAPTKDIVQNDDVIMTFSLCVGNDCVNGESFGFDTMRLKENNLRIHFDDTSNSASFPQNDWRIEVNDTSNGGTNHFSIVDATAGRAPFRVEAGASANALVVESDSDIGIGTLNPVVELHVVDGDSPTLRLEQDGSSGFTPQTYDLVSNEANFFIRDVTNGSQLPFRIKPGADSDALFIAANNNIGVGTDSPNALLHVRNSGSSFNPTNPSVMALIQNNANVGDASILALLSGATGQTQIFMGNSADENEGRIIYNNSTNFMRFDANNIDAMRIGSAGGVCIGCNDTIVGADFAVGDINDTPASYLNAGDTGFTVTSSRTFKENLKSVTTEGILEKISDIEVYTYDFIDGPTDRLGLMAEDFHQVFGRGSDKYLSSQEVQMAMWLAIQQLTAQNQELTKRLEEIEGAEQE